MTKTLFALALSVLLLGGCQTATKDAAPQEVGARLPRLRPPGRKPAKRLTRI